MFCHSKGVLRRTAILQVAREVFCEVGYASTSMASIAARLGGSKGTLYKYFRSKEELFAATLDDLIASYGGQTLLPAITGDDLEKTVTVICRKVSAAMASPPLLALFRLVIAESPRFPELGRAYHERLMVPAYRVIGAFLQQCMEKQLLKPADPQRAAAQLVALCRGDSFIRMLANTAPPPSSADTQADADAAAATFLAAFAVPMRIPS